MGYIIQNSAEYKRLIINRLIVLTFTKWGTYLFL